MSAPKRLRTVTFEADVDLVADALLAFVRKRHRHDVELQHFTNMVNILRQLAWTPADAPDRPKGDEA